MPKTTPCQRQKTGRVMHEFKHGELKRGRGGKVKSRKQAIAIALNEAGASNRQAPRQKRKAGAKTAKKQARGATAQQRREGKSKIGTATPKRKVKSVARKSKRKTTNRGRELRGRPPVI